MRFPQGEQMGARSSHCTSSRRAARLQNSPELRLKVDRCSHALKSEGGQRVGVRQVRTFELVWCTRGFHRFAASPPGRFLVTTVHTLLCLCLTDCKHAVRPRLPGLVALLLVRLQRCNQTDVAFHRRRVR
jgi:hypothetical protein